MKMPVMFIGHGSPMNIIEKGRITNGWIQKAKEIPKPRAILCVSAHWFTMGQYVSTAAAPETIYDFYGFPEELYQISYPAPGAPKLAEQAANLLGSETIKDSERGLDHGAWCVLNSMYPEADIPVFQASVNRLNSPWKSFQAGQKLNALRNEGILIIGSGDVVHNLHLLNWQMQGGYPWADSFDRYIKEALVSHNIEFVLNYQQAGKEEQNSFYYRDHFDPLLYCLGAVSDTDTVEVFNDERVFGSLSMTSYFWREK